MRSHMIRQDVKKANSLSTISQPGVPNSYAMDGYWATNICPWAIRKLYDSVKKKKNTE